MRNYADFKRCTHQQFTCRADEGVGLLTNLPNKNINPANQSQSRHQNQRRPVETIYHNYHVTLPPILRLHYIGTPSQDHSRKPQPLTRQVGTRGRLRSEVARQRFCSSERSARTPRQIPTGSCRIDGRHQTWFFPSTPDGIGPQAHAPLSNRTFWRVEAVGER